MLTGNHGLMGVLCWCHPLGTGIASLWIELIVVLYSSGVGVALVRVHYILILSFLASGLAGARVGEVERQTDWLPSGLSALTELSQDYSDFQSNLTLQKSLATAAADAELAKLKLMNQSEMNLPPVQSGQDKPVAKIPLLSEPSGISAENSLIDPGTGPVGEVSTKTEPNFLAAATGLPMALASVVPVSADTRLNGPREARIPGKMNWLKNDQVVANLQPKGETTFGGSGTDQGIFQKAKKSAETTDAFDKDEKPKDDDRKEKSQTQAMMDGMKAIAELNEGEKPFDWSDYFKGGDLLGQHEKRLSGIPKDQLDPGFLRNLNGLYEKFVNRDDTEMRQRYERFFQNLDPEGLIFPSTGERRHQNGIDLPRGAHQL